MKLLYIIKKFPMFEVISICVFLALWEILFLLFPDSLQDRFPDPVSVGNSFWQLCTTGDINGNSLVTHSVASLARLVVGFSLALLTGIPLGLGMSLRNSIYRIFKPLVEIIRPIPPIAWIPLAIALFQITYGPFFIIWLGAFFPILLNTITGVKRTSPILVDVAKTFEANEKTIIQKVIIPSSLPEIMTGIRVGLGVGWMSIIAAEMMGAMSILGEGPQGLGYLIFNYWMSGLIAPVVAGMIAIGIIAFLINEILLRIEKRIFEWKVEITK